MSDPNKLPLDWFKHRQLVKLSRKENIEKSGWLTTPLNKLLALLKDEVDELDGELAKPLNPEDVINECVDVANFAAMIAHKMLEEIYREEIYRNVAKQFLAAQGIHDDKAIDRMVMTLKQIQED